MNILPKTRTIFHQVSFMNYNSTSDDIPSGKCCKPTFPKIVNCTDATMFSDTLWKKIRMRKLFKCRQNSANPIDESGKFVMISNFKKSGTSEFFEDYKINSFFADFEKSQCIILFEIVLETLPSPILIGPQGTHTGKYCKRDVVEGSSHRRA